MSQLVLLIVCFAIGILWRRLSNQGTPATPVLNFLTINVALPALTILYGRKITVDWSLLVPISMAWIFFFLGYVFFRSLGIWLNWPPHLTGALMLTGGLGNTSFVGLPMIEAFFGKESLWVGMVADQAGSFFVLSTVGLAVAVRYGAGTFSVSGMFRKILLFPPFLSLLAGISMRDVVLPIWLDQTLERLGQMLVPMALMSVGYGLRLQGLVHHRTTLAIGLVFKLVLAPVLLFILYSLTTVDRGPIFQVTIFEAAMPPMITGAIIAKEHGLDERISTLMVGLGIPLSLLTLPLWWLFLR